MKYIKHFESIHVEDIEAYFLELSDYSTHEPPIEVDFETDFTLIKYKSGIIRIIIIYDFYDQVFVENKIKSIIKRLSKDYKIIFSRKGETGRYRNIMVPVNGTDRKTFVSNPIYKWLITITEK